MQSHMFFELYFDGLQETSSNISCGIGLQFHMCPTMHVYESRKLYTLLMCFIK